MNEKMRKRYIDYYSLPSSRSYNWGTVFYGLIPSLNIKNLCDVGCGDGKFLYDMVTRFGVEKAYGLDIAHVFLDTVKKHPKIEYFDTEAKSIPLSDNSVEYVTSFDVLEHILPEEIDDTLDELYRVATIGFLFTISNKLSSESDEDGNLHVIVEPPEWWFNKLSKYGNVIDLTPQRPSKNSHYKVDIKK